MFPGWERPDPSGRSLTLRGDQAGPLLCVVTGASHNFIKLFTLETELIFCEGFLCRALITFTGGTCVPGAAEPIRGSGEAPFKRGLAPPPRPPSAAPGFCAEEKINYYFNNEAKPAENPLREEPLMSWPAGGI